MSQFDPDLDAAICDLLTRLGLPLSYCADVRAHKFGATWGEAQRSLRALADDPYFVMQAAQCGS